MSIFYQRSAKIAKQRKIPFIELLRPEAVEVWKEFSQMPDRARY